MAILVLDKPITTEYVEVYNAERSGSEIGKEFTLIGWGSYGTIGSSPRSLRDNKFHRGMNVFTKINDNELIYKMDKQRDGGLELEAIAYSGDSGGPAFIEVDSKL